MLLSEVDLIDYLRKTDRPGLTVAQLAARLEQRRAERRWVTKCPALPFPGCDWHAGPLRDCEELQALMEQHMASAHPDVVPYYGFGVVDAEWYERID